MNKASLILSFLFLGLALVPQARAQGGHGPVFGLATPTLPQGAWNIDVTLMSAARGDRAFMARETIRYGLTPDIQLNLSVPPAHRGYPGTAAHPHWHDDGWHG